MQQNPSTTIERFSELLCVWSWALYLHFRYLKCLTFELSLEPSNFSIGGPRSIPLLIFSFICLKNSAAIFNLHKNHNLFWHETLGGVDYSQFEQESLSCSYICERVRKHGAWLRSSSYVYIWICMPGLWVRGYLI